MASGPSVFHWCCTSCSRHGTGVIPPNLLGSFQTIQPDRPVSGVPSSQHTCSCFWRSHPRSRGMKLNWPLIPNPNSRTLPSSTTRARRFPCRMTRLKTPPSSSARGRPDRPGVFLDPFSGLMTSTRETSTDNTLRPVNRLESTLRIPSTSGSSGMKSICVRPVNQANCPRWLSILL